MNAPLKPVVLDDEVPIPAEFAEIVARLAHEGVPVRALARSFEYHVTPIRECIRQAIYAGTITQMPRDDWPPGLTPAERAPSGRRPMSNEEMADIFGHIFKLTAKQASILTMLMRKPGPQGKTAILDFVYGGRDEPELKIIDVFICKIRDKLEKFNIRITTVWGRGYMLDTEDRTAITKLLDEFVLKQTKAAA